MIVSKSHFIQIEREVLLGDTVELCESFLGITPEAFQAVNIDFSICEPSFVVYPQMTVSTEHQCVVSSEFIRVDDRAPSNYFNGFGQKTFGRNIFNDRHGHLPFSLENSEYGDLSSGPSSSFTFSASAEVRFVHLNLPVQESFLLGEGHPKTMTGSQNSRVAQSSLLSDPIGRDFQFKELDDPQESFKGEAELPDPSLGEVMKGNSTSFATVFFTLQTIDSIAPTTAAENMALFPAVFPEKKTGFILCFPYELKGTKQHMHKINLVQDVL